ncbi:MAG TPA: pyridoxal phosphate-dependent aminotransferase [Gemmatimonadaceae bacterium]|nr:pyridoxal phosphate-dependent aminotransferase [Gemmatimonadaceae bacterium]
MSRAYVPSPNVSALTESVTIAASARAKALKAAGRPVIDLGAGEPDFDTPAFIRQAAERAIEQGATRYTATEGILPLREAIAAEANAAYGGDDRVDAKDVVVSNGSKQSLYNACVCLFGPGDEVLIPTPSWTSYYEMVMLARAAAVPVHGDPANGLKVTADDLREAATPRTRGVMLNSPCNPTGAVYTREELAAMLALAAERGWWVIADDIYVRIAYDSPVTTALELARSRERMVVVNGVAKAYAMTGWRIGWAVAPRELAARMAAFQSHTTSNPAAPSQYAALAALTDRGEAEPAIAAMVAQFRARRDAAVAVLDEAGMPYVRPDGAFYLYIRIADGAAGEGDPSAAFARRLLEEHDVAIVPGSAFYTPQWVRVSYAAPQAQVLEGLRRVVTACAPAAANK